MKWRRTQYPRVYARGYYSKRELRNFLKEFDLDHRVSRLKKDELLEYCTSISVHDTSYMELLKEFRHVTRKRDSVCKICGELGASHRDYTVCSTCLEDHYHRICDLCHKVARWDVTGLGGRFGVPTTSKRCVDHFPREKRGTIMGYNDFDVCVRERGSNGSWELLFTGKNRNPVMDKLTFP
jgi:hypothetical protein